MMTGRRKFIGLLFSGLGALAGAHLLLPSKTGGALQGIASGPASDPISDMAVKAMVFTIRYITEIINLPKDGKGMEIWIPLPRSDQEQEITELSIISPAPFNINEEPVFKNKMVHTGPANLKGGDQIALTYRIRRKTTGIVEERGDVKRHLVLTERERWDKDITEFADKVAGSERLPLETGRKIYNALVDYLTYDRDIPGCGQGISAWTFEKRRGKCDDFHALFRTMMIYRKIPVRWEQGIALPYPSVISKTGEFEGDCSGAHCWARFHAGDGRWFPVDISEANKRKDMRDYFFGTLSPNRFKISTGRDIVLNPPQGGGTLNTFYFAYGESEGIPLIYGHHYRNLVRYQLLNMET